MSALAPRDAYRLWAPTYAAETAISFLDKELTQALSPPLAGLRLLDAGCGIGRRMDDTSASLSVGVDLSPEMLAQGSSKAVAAADVRALPFGGAEFDLVWCRLVLGHLSDIASAYCELARVCRQGGHVLVTDFHADAVAAGHRRSFRDRTGAVHDVEHHVHSGAVHRASAEAAGLTMRAQRDGLIGPSIKPFFEKAGRVESYFRDQDLPVVAALLFQRSE